MNRWNHLTGGDSSETGVGPGSYDIRRSVWHVNCCSPSIAGGGGWGIFNGILGWQNSATYGSVIGYNLFWLLTILTFVVMNWREKRGSWPLMKAKEDNVVLAKSSSDKSVRADDVEKKFAHESTTDAVLP
jgi:high-affinity iron transporter